MASASDPRATYRRPPEHDPEDRRGPRQPLGAWTLGSLGEVAVAVDLGDRLELRVDRRRAILRPGAGLWLRSPALPQARVKELTLALGPVDLKLDADGLGPLLAASAGAVLAAAARLRLGSTPSESQTLADLWLARLPAGAGGRRQVAAFGRARVAIDPAAEVRAGIDRDAIEVASSAPIEVTVLGLRLRALALRYAFAERRVTFARPQGPWAWLSGLILMIAAWAATRWLRRRLQGPVGEPGYDPWIDEARLAHLRAAIAGLRPAGARPAARRPIDRRQLLADLRCSGPPAGAWLLTKLSLGTGASIGVVADQGDEVELEAGPEALRVATRGGVYLAVDGIPELAAIRLHAVHLRLADGRLTLEATPGVGELERALAEHLLGERALPRVPPALRGLLDPGGPGGGALAFGLGEGRRLSVRMPPGARLQLRHGPARTEARCEPGLRLGLDGLALVPELALRRATYRWADGAITLDTEPALGPLEEALLTHYVRHRIAARMPDALGLPGPEASPALATLERHAAAHALWEGEIAGVGRLRVLVDRDDTITVGVGPTWIDLTSGRGILLIADDLRLVFALEHVAVDRRGGGVAAVAEPAPGPYLGRLLAGLYRERLAPRLDPVLPPPPADPDAPWVLLARPFAGGEVRVLLAAGDRLELRRAPAHLALRARGGLTIAAPQLPAIRVDAVAWWPEQDRWDLSLEPSSGPLVEALVGRLAHRHAAPALERARSLALLPTLAAAPPPPPPPPGVVLWRREVAGVGAIHLALLQGHAITATIESGGAVEVAIEHGLRLRLRDLALRLVIHGLRASIDPWTLAITAEPELGPLERRLVDHLLAPHLGRLRQILWPEGDRLQGARVLAELYGDRPWGPLRLALPPAATLSLRLGGDALEVRAPAGLHVVLAGVPWLPDLDLRVLRYQLADGAIDLDFAGVVERYYHEAERVSPITKAIVAHVLKVMVSPRLPAPLRALGFRAFEVPELPPPRAGEIELVRVPAGALGEATLSMAATATIVVSAREDEVMVECVKGLVLRIPGLRLSVAVRGARYHPRSGEVQVGGLGQLENAIIEAMLRRHFGERVRTTPIADFVDTLPVDGQGRKVLFASAAATVVMREGTRFTLAFSAGGIDFSASPPLRVDGPGVLDYELGALRYSFPRARFAVNIADDGVLASLFTEVVAEAAARQLSEQLHPLLPPAMREPGYDLAGDPRSAEHIAAVIAAFGVRARGGGR